MQPRRLEQEIHHEQTQFGGDEHRRGGTAGGHVCHAGLCTGWNAAQDHIPDVLRDGAGSGTTLPAGTYLFRIGDPASQTYWQVWNKSGTHLLATFFYVPAGYRTYTEVARGDGRPIVRFHETTQGVPPALRVLYYPSQLEGNEFLYPREQAERIAAVSHHPVLALDDDAARGGVVRVVTVQPPTTESASK